MPEIAFIMGKSASGKDKIYKRLVQDETLGLKTITMYTTRPMRKGECNGTEYFFVSDAEAERMQQENKIIELRAYHTVYGVWKYFTVDDGQIDLWNGSRYIVIGTLEAYEQFCLHFGKEHILPIYIEVEDGLRLQRALTREMKQAQPKYDEMCRRFLADMNDFSEENLNRLGIEKRYENDGELEACIEAVTHAVRAGLV